jgi:hypothetical protein
VKRFSFVTFFAGLALEILAPASAALISAVWGRDVIPITPHDPEMVELNRSGYTKGDPVPELYGNRVPAFRVVFPDQDKIIVPPEDPSLTLYKYVGHPLQAQTLWFFAQWTMIGAGVMLALGGIGWLIFRRRSADRQKDRPGAEAAAAP